MWMGNYRAAQSPWLADSSDADQNFLLANFLGMCTYLACSTKLKTANGLE